jgi:quinolinate synthase
MTTKPLVLAHYYTTPEIQALADFVGDSLELSLKAQEQQPETIVFLGVRFMAETAKILSPKSKVLIPTLDATCSLVQQTDIKRLRNWREKNADAVHVSYINSSAQHKALSDWIVTSRNVDDIIAHITESGKEVIFSPDRNMGAYLNHEYGYNMKLWSAVCEVHDQFNVDKLDEEWRKWTDGPKYLLAHPESPLSVLIRASDLAKQGYGLVGSTSKMLNWIKEFPHRVGTIYVATEDGLLYNMRQLRPELDIRQAPIYSGCQCNVCPFMKMNTLELAQATIAGEAGVEIDYLTDEELALARIPLERMMAFSKDRYK